MTLKKAALSLPLFLLAVLLLIASPASADTINLILTNPLQNATPGSGLTFDATVSAPLANGATVYLNGDSFNASIPGSYSIDDSGFMSGFPLSLDPGDSFTGTLFTLTLPSNLAVGATYYGSFTITGGGDSFVLNDLATVNFQVNTVPEPGTWVLLLTGAGVFAAFAFNRRNLSQTTAA